MKNMGLKKLRLVDPEVTPRDKEALKMAVHAKDILEASQSFRNLEEALSGLTRVVGTSRRLSEKLPAPLSPREFVELSLQQSPDQKTGILFGTEDTGLTQGELKYCEQLIQIPSHPDFPSLNLAQAVMIVAYEWYLASLSPPDKISPPQAEGRPAPFEAKEALYEDLQGVLSDSGFLGKKNPLGVMRQIRNLLNRAQPSEKEVKILRGICRQLRWWASPRDPSLQ